MSFICHNCHTPQENGTKPVKVVLETRVRIYPARTRNGIVIDKGGWGTEIVKEVNMCHECATERGGEEYV